MTRLLSESLALWAGERPDEEAVEFGDLRLTWSQWHERVLRATGSLLSAGVARGDRVALIDRNHIAALDMVMAAGALGAVAILPNWRLRDEELSYILGDSTPKLVVLGEDFTNREAVIRAASPSIERVVHLGQEYEAWLRSDEPASPSPAAAASDVVLVMYTSGTTGAAKGVMFSHEGLDANAKVSAISSGARPGDRILLSMPLFHIGGIGSAVAAVHAGVPLTIVSEPTVDAIVEAIEHGCNRAFLVPAVISRMLQAGIAERRALASLSMLIYGGSPCPRPVLEEALLAMPTTEFVQVYGMTELCGTVTALTNAPHRDAQHPERLAAAGLPIEDVEVRIVDPQTLSEVDPGQMGELWFRTPKRMVGYLGRPQETAEVLVEGGWIRTGDIGRMDGDGFIFVEDRLKDIIITGGENVYSPEVESVLAEHPSVADVAVIGVPDARMGESVMAVVVPARREHFDPDVLVAYARERLAGFKCPRLIEVVDELPRNVSGKVLKRELRDSYGRRSQAEGRNE